ncbi:Hint domain-containing protein, partial [Candidatus Micrarchaeota archaeon]|nr:Hint domain-containing protein [Candidatus Micrarchaeota archaeon]
TLVSTPSGENVIEHAYAGDSILAFDENGNVVEARINGMVELLREGYFELRTRHARVNVTTEHPFLSGDGAFVEAKDLRVGDSLFVLKNGRLVEDVVESIRYVGKPVIVYNLVVNGPHTFFANTLAVHNKGCFLAGTGVKTPEGEKPIEELRGGDAVVGFDRLGRETSMMVSETYALERDHYYVISAGGRMVKATGEHPFLTPLGWIEARNLKKGDFVFIDDGKRLKASRIELARRVDASVRVFNLQVGGMHTFIAAGFGVHNKGGGCFPGETCVADDAGACKLIKDVKSSDVILSFDEKGNPVRTTVEEVYELEVDGMYTIKTLRHEVNVTAEHPFYRPDTSLVKAEDLRVGDRVLVLENGRLAEDELVSRVYMPGANKVYNLRAGGPNAFFANDFAVHNKGGCFLAGTQVSTPSGKKEIEKLEAGAAVYSFDSHGILVESKVKQLVKVIREGYFRISTESASVDVTGEHPFLTPRGWVEAEDLRVGRSVTVENNGRMVREAVISKQYVPERVDAYNLEVEEPHTFIAAGFGVHNKGGSIGGRGSSSCKTAEECSSDLFAIIFIIIFLFCIMLPIFIVSRVMRKGRGGWETMDQPAPRGAIDKKTERAHRLLNFLSTGWKGWNEQQMVQRVRSSFTIIQAAWEARNYSGAAMGVMMPDIYKEHVEEVNAMIQRHEKNELRNLGLEDVKIILVRNHADKRKNEFVAWVSAHAQDVIVNDKNGAIIRGDDDVYPFEEFWTFSWAPDNTWKLKEITQVRQGSKILSEDNFDEESTPEQMKWYYEHDRAL